MKTAEEIVKALRWLAMETEFVFGKEQLIAAADLIESLQADNAELRKANSEYQDAQHPLFMALSAAQRRADAAVWKLQSIDWVGSGAKARIEDAIAILTECGAQAGEENDER